MPSVHIIQSIDQIEWIPSFISSHWSLTSTRSTVVRFRKRIRDYFSPPITKAPVTSSKWAKFKSLATAWSNLFEDHLELQMIRSPLITINHYKPITNNPYINIKINSSWQKCSLETNSSFDHFSDLSTWRDNWCQVLCVPVSQLELVIVLQNRNS